MDKERAFAKWVALFLRNGCEGQCSLNEKDGKVIMCHLCQANKIAAKAAIVFKEK